ncbi:hypothetical protein BASA81_002083 [Batrachochytrium salamandrivorans]|nr:hypothetical protein BASA81_002083 [Batrachochytrium salamandrivorans]
MHAAANTSASPAGSSKRANVFVQSLYDLVSTCPQDVIGFSPSGTSFEIRNVNALCEVVLCQYFKHKNLSSFFRQLNLYGFSKLREFYPSPPPPLCTRANKPRAIALKNAGHAFHHEFFVQGRPDLLANVTRVKTHTTKRGNEASAAAAAAATAGP